MIFADKLIQLRKKNGWSQEELAEQMNVTRQSVSKWEGAQSIPDLEKILKLSELFGVTTDYLLKDEIEETENINTTKDNSSLRTVSMEEANAFLSVKAATSKLISFAVFLCIISPICLIVLSAFSEIPKYGLSENAAVGIGMTVLLILIAIAVAIFISSGSKTSSFEYLEKEMFETEYGVTGMVKERKKQYTNKYTGSNITGACICILAMIPLFIGITINENDDLLMILMLSITLLLIAIGVNFFVHSGIIWASFEKLLQQGEYSKQKKKHKSATDAFSTGWWLTATAIYLSYSFITDNWEYSWIVWVIAGILYPVIISIINISKEKKEND